MEIEIDVIAEDPRWDQAGLGALAKTAWGAAAAHLSMPPGYAVALLGCDDARIAALNADFRGKPQPTNVLSWPSAERATPGAAPPLPGPSELGDIAIAFETCQREAAAQNKSVQDHVCHLLVHGLLHLLGYDHETEQDAALMEALEAEILATMGIADPY